MADNAGQRVIVAEAALALGVSSRTVRRWASLGKIPVRSDVRPYLVDITGQMTEHGGQRPDVTDRMATELEGLRTENERLRERVQELVQERDYLGLGGQPGPGAAADARGQTTASVPLAVAKKGAGAVKRFKDWRRGCNGPWPESCWP